MIICVHDMRNLELTMLKDLMMSLSSLVALSPSCRLEHSLTVRQTAAADATHACSVPR